MVERVTLLHSVGTKRKAMYVFEISLLNAHHAVYVRTRNLP